MTRRVAVVFLIALQGMARAVSSAPDVPVAPPATATIGVTDAPARVEEVAGRLTQILERAKPTPAVTTIAGELPATTAVISEHARRDRERLAEAVDLGQLGSIDVWWSDDEVRLADWDQTLRRRAEELDRLVVEVGDLHALWARTLDALRAAAAPSALLDRVSAVLGTIGTASAQVTARRDEVLTLRNRVARQRALVAEARGVVEHARRQVLANLQMPDQPPLWALYGRSERAPIAVRIRDGVAAERADLDEFLRTPRANGPRALGAAVALVVAMLLLARRVRAWRADGKELASVALIAERPVSAAAMLWVLVLPMLHVPMAVRRLVSLVLVLPLARLLWPLLGLRARPALGFIVSVIVTSRLGEVLAGVPEVARPLLLAESGLALWGVRWFRRTWLASLAPEFTRARWIGRLAWLAEGTLVVALVVNVIGYQQLAALLTDGTSGAALLGLLAWVLARVLDGVIAVAVESRPFTSLRLVQRYRNLVVRRVRMVVEVGLTLLWAVAALRGAHLLDLATTIGRDVFGTPIGLGALAFTLGDVLAFVAALGASFALSRLVRAVLEDEVLSRIELPRGVPYAVSTFASYAVLVTGVVLALVAAGIDFARITIVIGALGVGVGLGLQEIVKDLVAGAVLLFERSIQPGDIVQMGTLVGDVRRIGLRSSTVRTFDGSEVIVPNSALTASQIVNWTLSDRARRVDLPVGVAYGTDPARVIALLEELAHKHPDTLVDPAPRALFMGFGASSLDFELRCWTTRVDQAFGFRSEMGVAVNAALTEAGITVPFPQRDVHVRTVPPGWGGEPTKE